MATCPTPSLRTPQSDACGVKNTTVKALDCSDMSLICDVVQKALETGYLTLEAEEQLRQLLQTTRYGREDLNAFMTLQQATMAGIVRQESRELIQSQSFLI